jgi:hypothetical protein
MTGSCSAGPRGGAPMATWGQNAQAGEDRQRALGRVERLGHRHPRQIEKIPIGQGAHLQGHQFDQLLAQAEVASIRQFQHDGAALEQLHQRFLEQFLFTGEVIVDGAFRYPGKRGNPVHAGGLEAMRAELFGSSHDDGAALAVGKADGQIHASILHSPVYFHKNRNYTV